MTKEELIKDNFPNDQFLQSAVSQIVDKCTAELEEENAELKSIADFQTSSNMDRYFKLKRQKEQLTKAKELIKKLVYEFQRLCLIKKETITEVEQFLKGEL